MLKKVALLGFLSGFALFVYARKNTGRDSLVVDSSGEPILRARRRPF
ncbi:hypothetical protein [Chitinasiproducens palmae]|uniref:Uncharacterized protein n=1 Tax=Chitinasiproducens palmae TaxID=1770053 RepID=A0A1H2PX03_9BURK|nr:hypothetical protein [Chitinasiproducens palmae]SDV51586.1 hypothetical protein SAMN05216551_1197 [Chitinasiproducens palmae]